MNIIQIQDRLKGVADNALIGYVQNPTGEVPTYLALTELNRRKEMRNNYQKEKAPDTSVAEDLTQEAQPQQGLGALAQAPQQMPQQAMAPQPEMPTQQMAQGGLVDLPVNDTMFQEQNYAGGGIVAFDDGGNVKHYDGTSGSEVNGTSRLGDYYRNLRATNLKKQEENKLRNQLLSEKYRIQGDIFSSLTPEQKAAQDTSLKQIDAQLTNMKGSSDNQPGGYVMPPGTSAQLTDNEVANNNAPAAVPEKNPFDAYKPATMPVEKIGSLSSYADEMNNYIGEDPMKQKLADRLAKMESKASTQETQAPWMALAQAGFGMAAGKSPFAMQNIAEGAGMGLKSYAEAKDKLNALEEKRFGLENDLARANRAEKIAVAKYGADSKQAAHARAQATELHNSSMTTQVQIAKIGAAVTLGNKAVTNRNLAVDNATKKADTLAKNNNITTAAEYDAIYQPILQQELAALGLTGTGTVSQQALPQGVKVTRIK